MGPIIRIVLRYGVGAVLGYQIGNHLAADPDVVAVGTVVGTAVVGIATEGFYALARRWGWQT